MFGGEYDWQDVSPVADGNVLFHGGNLATAWLITGETRGYNTAGGYFNAVSPERTVFEGGPGAWEAVLNFSYIDLDSGMFHGGKYWRVTPMVNWHMSDNLRLEFVYGYGELDRFDTTGGTQFFQSRIQLLFRRVGNRRFAASPQLIGDRVTPRLRTVKAITCRSITSSDAAL